MKKEKKILEAFDSGRICVKDSLDNKAFIQKLEKNGIDWDNASTGENDVCLISITDLNQAKKLYPEVADKMSIIESTKKILKESSNGQVDIDGNIYLYQHYDGDKLPIVVKKALTRGKERWGDKSYLTRIIFSEMTKGHEDEITGFGISTERNVGPNKDIEIDTDKQIVKIGSKEWSFEDYVKTPDTEQIDALKNESKIAEKIQNFFQSPVERMMKELHKSAAERLSENILDKPFPDAPRGRKEIDAAKEMADFMVGSEASFENPEGYVIYFAQSYIEISKDDKIVTTFHVDDVKQV